MFEFLLLTRILQLGQYDILHQLQDEVEFGVGGQLVVRFPLPRLHQISRLFTVEYDSRVRARPLIIVSQKHGDIQTFTRVYTRWCSGRFTTPLPLPEPDNRPPVEPIRFPRIVNLRNMQNRHPIETLRINLYACNGNDRAAEPRRSVLHKSVRKRLEWINAFVENTCSPAIGLRVYTRLMLDDVKDVHMIKRFRDLRHWIRPDSKLEIVVDCPSEQECHEDEFSRAKTLSVTRNECIWPRCFDDQEIRRCEALAELRSGWSTAAASPTSGEGERIGDQQASDRRQETSINEEPGAHEEASRHEPPASLGTIRIAHLLDPE